MIEIGQEFSRDGYSLCVLDIFDYNFKKYALMSIEREKVEYKFYEIIYINSTYRLAQVNDTTLEHQLFAVVEGRGL
ncbi:MAG: hypothetical protein IKT40_06340 [Bacilli bacterium]|nr:hypothetical protein [Bacilli bacterium]